MAPSFDPYHTWLGIPPDEQPPHHYALLGVRTFESNADVIANAADKQMAHLRTFQIGQHADASQKLLAEVAAARLCLLKAEKKAAYDKKLRASLGGPATQQKAAAKPVARPAAQAPAPRVRAKPLEADGDAPSIELREESTVAGARRRASSWRVPAAVGAVVAILGIGLLVFALPRLNQEPADIASTEVPTVDDTDDTPATTTTDDPADLPDVPDETTDDNVEIPVEVPDEPPAVVPSVEDDPPAVESTPDEPPAAEPPPEPEPTVPVETTPEVAPPAEPPKRRDVPNAEAQEETLAEIKSLFKEAYAGRQPEDQLALAQGLFEQAAETADDPVAHYVLLSEARQWALAAGDFSLAMQAVDATAEVYDIDPWGLKTEAVAEAARQTRDREARLSLAQAALALADEAEADDRLDLAEEIAKTVVSLASRVRDGDLRKAATERRTAFRKAKPAWQAAQQAAAVLDTNPDDPQANLDRGKYLGFVRGDWATALPHLAKGSDAKLAGLAARDLESPTAMKDRLALADAWHELATDAKDEVRGAGGRALHWYRQVLPDAVGLDRARIEQRIAQWDAEGAPGGRTAGRVAPLPWIRGPVGEIFHLDGHTATVGSLDVSPDGRYAVSGSRDASVRLWDLSTGKPGWSMKSRYHVDAVRFTPDGRAVLAGTGTRVSILDAGNGQAGGSLPCHGNITHLDLSADGRLLLTCISRYSTGQQVRLFDLATLKLITVLDTPPKTVQSAAISPDGRRALLGGHGDPVIRLWDLTTLKPIRDLAGHQSDVVWVRFSADGRFAISASGEGTLFWELATGKRLGMLQSKYTGEVEFTPDGRRVVASAVSYGVSVWDLATGGQVAHYKRPGQDAFLESVAVTPDGRGALYGTRGTNRIHVVRLPD